VVLEDEPDVAAQDRERGLASDERFCPFTTTLPRVARSIPEASLRRVDLPAPSAP